MLVGARRHAAPKLRSIPTPTVSGGFSAELAFVTSQRCETVTVYWICYVRVEASIDFCRICVKWIDCGTMIHNGHSTWEIANTAFPTPVSLAYLTSAGRDIMRNVWKTDAYSLTVCDPYKSIIYGYFSPDATRSRIWSTVQHCIMKACGQFCGACGCLALHTLIGAHYAPCDQFVDQHSPPRLKRTYELQEVCFSERSQHYGVHSETSTHISTHTHMSWYCNQHFVEREVVYQQLPGHADALPLQWTNLFAWDEWRYERTFCNCKYCQWIKGWNLAPWGWGLWTAGGCYIFWGGHGYEWHEFDFKTFLETRHVSSKTWTPWISKTVRSNWRSFWKSALFGFIWRWTSRIK